MTILGDIAQGIYAYRGTTNWQKINENIFNNQAIIEHLNNSYRTTFEIMNEANKILSKIKERESINLAVPISRHDEKVNYIKTTSFDEKVKIAEKRIIELNEKGDKNIAIIVKNIEGCNNLYKRINQNKLKVNLLSEEQAKYTGGTTIVPSYLSKGLEFDCVILFDFNSYDMSNIDIKLLYVAMTRAMHTLGILF